MAVISNAQARTPERSKSPVTDELPRPPPGGYSYVRKQFAEPGDGFAIPPSNAARPVDAGFLPKVRLGTHGMRVRGNTQIFLALIQHGSQASINAFRNCGSQSAKGFIKSRVNQMLHFSICHR
jgi:hypothetical protein